MDEKELLDELRKLPDFECFPLPASWYKKYGLTPPGAVNPREYIESNYAIKCSVAPKDLPPLIIREPQQNGKLVDAPPVEEIKAETLCRPYTLTETPDVLPSLRELPIPE
jgi:hypothetical protein